MKRIPHRAIFALLCVATAGSLANDAFAQRATARVSVSDSSGKVDVGAVVRSDKNDGWIDLEFEAEAAGRYRCEVTLAEAKKGTEVWVEDYIGNPDGRSYDITGPMIVPEGGGTVSRVGSPMDRGPRKMRLHHRGGPIALREVAFERVKPLVETPCSLVQRTTGEQLVLAWSDEFEGDGPVDSKKWTYDIGDWGWGNRELQTYTEARLENARRENGCLVIEARRNDDGHAWTSARLTTRGKISFLRGRIEFRAKTPAEDGAWAAAWLLGDAYRDEKSWPYCGEVDVLEGVGREIDDATGDGLNHASCHTRAFYFKQGNHISNTRNVKRMASDFHVYAIEWTDRRITAEVDGETYYVYDKVNGPLEWPFHEPQNLILNLAMGGGMGGAVDPKVDRVRFVVDYVRVFGRQ